MWKELKGLNIQDTPQIILGDFNAIMNMDERIDQPVRLIDTLDMQDFTNHCKLIEIKSSGQFYTWNNNQNRKDRVFCKLNRVLGTADWIDAQPMIEVIIFPEGDYDHCSLVLKSSNE